MVDRRSTGGTNRSTERTTSMNRTYRSTGTPRSRSRSQSSSWARWCTDSCPMNAFTSRRSAGSATASRKPLTVSMKKASPTGMNT